MSIKSDKWIRRMSEKHGMIEPFESNQVKKNTAGGSIVSYGTSSYGYDVRCANEFKIFTNINSTIVDPKAFDKGNFVSVESDVCIIPPNSFALARTVEYFRIPRETLVICLGKSTYARCFRGDTRIALADGSTPTFKELAKIWSNRKENSAPILGYGINDQGFVVMTHLVEPRIIDEDELVEVVLSNGESVFCTADHEFLCRDGSLCPASALTAKTELMPLDVSGSGQRLVYQPKHHGFTPNSLLRTGWMKRCPEEAQYFIDPVRAESFPESKDEQAVQVVEVKECEGEAEDVYCLTAPETGNFALASGIFVKNCGIIVNVTPLEPEWEGHVTLEFSNTTPLPAKIYANEGVAQMLFFESDEPCETSYADRKGKYQGQQGVTLPKT